MRRIATITALACVSIAGCSSPTRSPGIVMFDRPVKRTPPRNSNLLFDPNPIPGAADPSSFVRSDWPSTPRKWVVTSEEVRWRETTHDHQGGAYGHRGHGGHDQYHRVFRSERRGRAKANR